VTLDGGERAQAFYAGVSRPRELSHDVQLYRATCEKRNGSATRGGDSARRAEVQKYSGVSREASLKTTLTGWMIQIWRVGWMTGLEPATSGATDRRSNL
jgi:hypothetical protein